MGSQPAKRLPSSRYVIQYWILRRFLRSSHGITTWTTQTTYGPLSSRKVHSIYPKLNYKRDILK